MTADTQQPTTANTDRIPWTGIAIGGAVLVALFVAAPFIQIWIDSIPRYEERPSVPLESHTLSGNEGIIRLPSDGRYVAAASDKETYLQYIELHNTRAYAEEPTVRLEAVEQLERMLDADDTLLRLMSGSKLTVIGGDSFVSQVEVTSGRHAGDTGWLANQFIRHSD